MSLVALAAKSKVGLATVCRAERWHFPVSPPTAKKLAAALDCKAQELFPYLTVAALCLWLSAASVATAGGPIFGGGRGGTTPGQVSNIVSGMTANFATLEQVGNAVLGSMSVFAPTNLSAPTISGAAMVGETLTGSTGVWFSALPVSAVWCQWLKDGGGISGETNLTYSIGSNDVGSVLAFRISMTNALGLAIATSAATAAVTNAPAPPSHWRVKNGNTAPIVDPENPGSGYQQDDVVTLVIEGATTAPQRKINVDENGNVTGTDLIEGQQGDCPAPVTGSIATTGGNGSGLKLILNGDAWESFTP